MPKTIAEREMQCDHSNKVGRMRAKYRDLSHADLVNLPEMVAAMARDAMPVAADIAGRIERVATHRDEVQARWNIRRMKRAIERADRLIDIPARPTTQTDPDDQVEHYERWDSCC